MILLVGYGYWGKNLARNFGKNLVAICEQDPAKQMAALELYPDVTMYDKIDEALKNDKVKAVALATKAHSHYDLAIKCIDAGKDLWIEKPVCETLDQVYYLNDYAVKCMYLQVPKKSKFFKEIKENYHLKTIQVIGTNYLCSVQRPT